MLSLGYVNVKLHAYTLRVIMLSLYAYMQDFSIVKGRYWYKFSS
jgi:hypothetical protein